ncbi:MAG: putative helix-turn-helix domain protein [Naasia sp.]|nr:putative helix-turn-helix domain protein [Naasia sp.]
MDASTATLAAAIGARVRQARQDRRWTLDTLAEAAGVSRRMLVNVEQGAVNPSLGTLLRLGEALGVGLPALVEAPTSEPMTVTRSGTGPTLWRGDSGGAGVLVSGTATPDVFELWDWRLEPGERHDSEPHAPGARELVSVQEGALALAVADRTTVLERGDASAFRGDLPHSYANPGAEPVRFSLAVFEPRTGASHQEVTRG